MYADTVEPAYLGSLSADRAARSQQIYLLHKNVSKNQGAALLRIYPSSKQHRYFTSSANAGNKYILTECVENQHDIRKHKINAVKAVNYSAVTGKYLAVILDTVLSFEK